MISNMAAYRGTPLIIQVKIGVYLRMIGMYYNVEAVFLKYV